jgi:hypothetical protein
LAVCSATASAMVMNVSFGDSMRTKVTQDKRRQHTCSWLGLHVGIGWLALRPVSHGGKTKRLSLPLPVSMFRLISTRNSPPRRDEAVQHQTPTHQNTIATFISSVM